MTDKERIKEQALKELHQSEELRTKIDQILFRNHIHRETNILDDVFQETFYHLSRKTPEFISELYLDNPRRLLGLAIKIAIWKGVSKRKDSDYPKHSLARHILFTSNFQSLKYLSPTETYDGEGDNHSYEPLVDNDTVERETTDVMGIIRSQLDPDNLQFMDEYLQKFLVKGNGKKPYMSVEVKQKYERLTEEIKRIVKDAGIEKVWI